MEVPAAGPPEAADSGSDSVAADVILDLCSRGVSVTCAGDMGDARRPAREACGRRQQRHLSEPSAPAHLSSAREAATVRRCRDLLRCEESALSLLRRVQHAQAGESAAQSAVGGPLPPSGGGRLRSLSGAPPAPRRARKSAAALTGSLSARTGAVGRRRPPSGAAAANSPSLPLSASHAVGGASRQPPPTTTAERRRRRAALTLRRQLEQSLLDVQPPSPPPTGPPGPPGFVPEAVDTGHFVRLLGLEAVVDYIQPAGERTSAGEAPRCRLCGLDFAAVWHRQSVGERVTCDRCVTNAARRSVGAQHTRRLKAVFEDARRRQRDVETMLPEQERRERELAEREEQERELVRKVRQRELAKWQQQELELAKRQQQERELAEQTWKRLALQHEEGVDPVAKDAPLAVFTPTQLRPSGDTTITLCSPERHRKPAGSPLQPSRGVRQAFKNTHPIVKNSLKTPRAMLQQSKHSDQVSKKAFQMFKSELIELKRSSENAHRSSKKMLQGSINGSQRSAKGSRVSVSANKIATDALHRSSHAQKAVKSSLQTSHGALQTSICAHQAAGNSSRASTTGPSAAVHRSAGRPPDARPPRAVAGEPSPPPDARPPRAVAGEPSPPPDARPPRAVAGEPSPPPPPLPSAGDFSAPLTPALVYALQVQQMMQMRQCQLVMRHVMYRQMAVALAGGGGGAADGGGGESDAVGAPRHLPTAGPRRRPEHLGSK